MKNWEPVDYVILGITALVCSGLFVATVAPVITGLEAGDKAASIIGGLYMGLIAIISLYVGMKIRK